MSLRLKTLIQYFILLSLTGLLVWVSLQGLQVVEGENKWEYLTKTWHAANKRWLVLMAIVALISHLIRAERWRMLMNSSGFNIKLSHSFYSLMIGYLVNLVVPRGGEVSRCYNLYKLNKAPVDMSFGTVVLERIIDLLCLVVLLGFSFLLESKKLFGFIETLPIAFDAGTSQLDLLIYGLTTIVFGGLLVYFVIRSNPKIILFIQKTWAGFKTGLLSIFKLENKGLFVFYTALIWLLYFLMSYTVIRAFPSTAELGFNAVLSLFAIGAIAMAIPLPGGAGSYHVLVPQGLVFLYHLPRADAIAFTFIFHGWQTIIMIIAGAISLLITTLIVKKNTNNKSSGDSL